MNFFNDFRIFHGLALQIKGHANVTLSRQASMSAWLNEANVRAAARKTQNGQEGVKRAVKHYQTQLVCFLPKVFGVLKFVRSSKLSKILFFETTIQSKVPKK